MDKPPLGPDFKEFLKLLNDSNVEYLLIGGYAVAYHGYSRPTGDMDIWVSLSPENIQRTLHALRLFGFDLPELTADLFMKKQVLRMGVSPNRIEVLTRVSGVEFAKAFQERLEVDLDGITVSLINRENLIANKKAAGRLKDLADIENLP